MLTSLGGVDAIRTFSRDCSAAAHSLGWWLSDVPRSQRIDSSAAAIRRHLPGSAFCNGHQNGIDLSG